MAGRIRSIKPEILDDEEACTLSDEAWRLWVSMWLLADDHGNCRAADRYLAALVWQDTGRSPRISEILRELRRGRIEVYENNGERFAHIRNWEKHQRIDNAGKPRVPGPDHKDSHSWEQFRGNFPRISASLGDSPLDHDHDLRPPTLSLSDARTRVIKNFQSRHILMPDADSVNQVLSLITGYVGQTTERPEEIIDRAFSAFDKLSATWKVNRFTARLFSKHWEEIQRVMGGVDPGVRESANSKPAQASHRSGIPNAEETAAHLAHYEKLKETAVPPPPEFLALLKR